MKSLSEQGSKEINSFSFLKDESGFRNDFLSFL